MVNTNAQRLIAQLLQPYNTRLYQAWRNTNQSTRDAILEFLNSINKSKLSNNNKREIVNSMNKTIQMSNLFKKFSKENIIKKTNLLNLYKNNTINNRVIGQLKTLNNPGQMFINDLKARTHTNTYMVKCHGVYIDNMFEKEMYHAGFFQVPKGYTIIFANPIGETCQLNFHETTFGNKSIKLDGIYNEGRWVPNIMLEFQHPNESKRTNVPGIYKVNKNSNYPKFYKTITRKRTRGGTPYDRDLQTRVRNATNNVMNKSNMPNNLLLDTSLYIMFNEQRPPVPKGTYIITTCRGVSSNFTNSKAYFGELKKIQKKLDDNRIPNNGTEINFIKSIKLRSLKAATIITSQTFLNMVKRTGVIQRIAHNAKKQALKNKLYNVTRITNEMKRNLENEKKKKPKLNWPGNEITENKVKKFMEED